MNEKLCETTRAAIDAESDGGAGHVISRQIGGHGSDMSDIGQILVWRLGDNRRVEDGRSPCIGDHQTPRHRPCQEGQLEWSRPLILSSGMDGRGVIRGTIA